MQNKFWSVFLIIIIVGFSSQAQINVEKLLGTWQGTKVQNKVNTFIKYTFGDGIGNCVITNKINGITTTLNANFIWAIVDDNTLSIEYSDMKVKFNPLTKVSGYEQEASKAMYENAMNDGPYDIESKLISEKILLFGGIRYTKKANIQN